jgi:hypothetical protein
LYSGQEDRQVAGDRDGDRKVDQQVRDLYLGPPHLYQADHPGPVRRQLCKLSTWGSRAARDTPKSLKV